MNLSKQLASWKRNLISKHYLNTGGEGGIWLVTRWDQLESGDWSNWKQQCLGNRPQVLMEIVRGFYQTVDHKILGSIEFLTVYSFKALAVSVLNSCFFSSQRWTNGTRTVLARRQRVSLIRDPETNRPTHVINGADFNKHLSPGLCEGCHWGQGLSLIVPLNIQD